jgi:CysZ protein
MVTLAPVSAVATATSAPKRAALGFFAGVRALFGGIGFIMTKPSVWGWAMIPVVVATVLFGGTAGLAIWGGNHLSEAIAHGDTTLSAIGMWTLRVLFWIIGLVVGFVIAFSLAQPISGFALEAIVRRQEQSLGGRKWPDQPFFHGMVRSLRVSLTALLIGLPILGVLALITFLAPPAGVVTIPLKFIVTGLLAAYDFLDYPFSVRGIGVRERLTFMKQEIWAVLGFGLSIAAILTIPGVGLFLLPLGVAGATRMVVERDKKIR